MDKGSAKERLIIKLVCVLLSFGLWIYVTNVETTVKTYTLKDVPVKIVNVDALKTSGLALAPGQKFDVNLNLEGPSKYIYSINKSDFNIQADLSEYALKKGENNIPVQIINYPQQLNIKNNGYLIVKVKLESLETKTFNSVSDVNVSFASNVYKDSVNYTPEKIEVSGAESAINSIEKIALVGTLNDVSGDITKTFKYEPLDSAGNIVKDVTLSKNTGTISITTNSGKRVSIASEFSGSLPKGISLVSTELSQNYVNVIGDKEALENVNSIKTESIDLTNIKADTKKTVKLILPKGVKLSNGGNTISISIDVSGKVETSTDNKDENTNQNGNDNNTPTNQNEEKSLSIPVTFNGLDKGLKLTNSEGTITIQISGGKDIVDNITAGDFTATVDLSSYKEAGDFSVTPKVTTSKNVVIKSIPSVKITIAKETSDVVAKK